MNLRPRALLVPLLLSGVALLTPSVVHVIEEDHHPTQERIEEIIAEYGGEQTAWNEISWNDGDVVFTAAPLLEAGRTPSATTTLTRNCDSGRHCAFSGTGYSGERLTFSSCSSNQNIGVLASVQSVANNRTGKSIKVYKNSAILATVPANSGGNVSTGATSLTCS